MGLRSASAKRRYTRSVIALVAVLSASAASAVQVTLPNISIGSPPSGTDVGVAVADTTGILGVAVSFTYSAAVVTATQVNGTALATGCTIVPSISTPGMVVITAACPNGLPSGGSGALFIVKFSSVANGHSALTFTMTDEVPNGCFLNEGTPSCQPQNGAIDVGPVVATPTASNTTTPVATATNTLPVATATNTLPVATATNTSPVNTATASATRTATSTVTSAVATTTASATATITFTNTAGPSPTPSETRTTTATVTPSQTGTTTSTPVSTNTTTATVPATQTPTQTQTPTVTPTRTITNTRNATATRAAIPVVPSPASPAGILMVIGLGAGLVWALRRAAKH